jgi:hypothetical protein
MNQPECPEKRQDAAEATAAELAVLGAFDADQQERLVRLRRLVANGERSDHYPIDRRQHFVRWLIDQGKLSDN